jgi:BirA family biotin operon repressor/biotin-[acetyl-CoA-carboxylase] ligase
MDTLFIGKNTIFLPEVESTNTYAMDLLRNVNAIEGTVIHTDNQVKGKGQRGSVWNSKIAQNITASIILKPNFLIINQSFYLSKISALAVYDLLSEIFANSQYDIKIKWPNDILINSQKIAGILIENNFSNQFIQSSIIGMGLNVNQTEFDDYNRQAVSIKLLLNQSIDRQEVMEKLCSKLEKWYLLLKSNKTAEIDKVYNQHLYKIDVLSKFYNSENILFEGKIIDVNKLGKLLVQTTEGNIKEFDIKDIKFID